MVGPLLLFKMLHNRRINSRNRNAGVDSPAKVSSQSSQENPLEIKILKKENDENICRVCLKEGSIPIYGDNEGEDISESLNTFGSIDVRIDDPYPKYLCTTCNSLLQGAILFRKTAQQSDEILKIPPMEEIADNINEVNSMEISDEDIPLKYIKQKVKKRTVRRCRKCNVMFDTFKELDDHIMSEEHRNMRHVCPYCQKSFAPFYYKRHLDLHTKGAPYMCDVCGKDFMTRSQFTKHRLIHSYTLPYKCSLCPYKGRFRESLKMHMRSHTGERPYQCSECPSKFISKSNLNKHMLTHKEVPDFKCDPCGKRFYTKREVEVHYKVDHTDVKDYVCKFCNKVFGNRKRMIQHERRVHKRAKLRGGITPIYLKVESMQQQGQNIVTES